MLFRSIMGETFYDASLNRWGLENKIKKRYQIPVVSLASVIESNKIDPRYCILKLDVEGMEYEVLKYVVESNITFHKIYCEFHLFDAEHEALKKMFASRLAKIGTSLHSWD